MLMTPVDAERAETAISVINHYWAHASSLRTLG